MVSVTALPSACFTSNDDAVPPVVVVNELAGPVGWAAAPGVANDDGSVEPSPTSGAANDAGTSVGESTVASIDGSLGPPPFEWPSTAVIGLSPAISLNSGVV